MRRYVRRLMKRRVWVILLCFLTLVPAVMGIGAARVRYDLLTFLAENADSVRGRNVLMDEFGKGAVSLVLVSGMRQEEAQELKERMKETEHVADVQDLSETMPDVQPADFFSDALSRETEEDRLFAVYFDSQVPDQSVLDAVDEVRALAGSRCLISGIAAAAADVRKWTAEHALLAILIASVVGMTVLSAVSGSVLLGLMILLTACACIVWNLGTNFLLREISQISIAASVLVQLGLTLVPCMVLVHAYQKGRQENLAPEEAMNRAMRTILPGTAGTVCVLILAMLSVLLVSPAAGKNLAPVIIKGSLLCAAGTLILFPCLLRTADGSALRAAERTLRRDGHLASRFVLRHAGGLCILVVMLAIPSCYGFLHLTQDAQRILAFPENIAGQAEEGTRQPSDLPALHILEVKADLPARSVKELSDAIRQVPGVQSVYGLPTLLGTDMPEAFLAEDIRSLLKSRDHQLLIAESAGDGQSFRMHEQIKAIQARMKLADADALLTGDAVMMDDLTEQMRRDTLRIFCAFAPVLFLLSALLLKSFTFSAVITLLTETVCAASLSLLFFAGKVVPASVPVAAVPVVTGLTCVEALLLSGAYLRERKEGRSGREAASLAVRASAGPLSAGVCCLAAACLSLGIYLKIKDLSLLCLLTALGAVVSVFAVLFALPALLILSDRFVLLFRRPSRQGKRSRET